MNKIILTLIIFNFVAAQSFAGEIIRQYRGSRSLGMGGVVTTTGMYDEALFGNPALHAIPETWKVSIINITGEANTHIISDVSKLSSFGSASGGDMIAKVADSGIIGHNEHERVSNVTGVYIPHFFSANNSFAFGLFINQMSNIHFRTNIDLDFQGLVDAGPAAGFARKFMDGSLMVGINLRAIYRIGADRIFKPTDFLSGKKLAVSEIGGQGMGIDGDIGGYYKIPLELPIVRFSVGASINNVAASNYDLAFKTVVKKINATPPKNYTNANFGLRFDFDDLLLLQDNKASIEVQNMGAYNQPISNWKRVHAGVETRLLKFLSLRAGLNQGYYTAGVGFNLPVLKLDIATYGEEIGTNAGMLEDRRYVARLALEI